MSSPARRLRLVAMTKNKQNPAYIGARLGADRVAARLGADITHKVPDTPDDIDEQHALLKQAHAERPDAVLIVPAHATALNGTLRQMQADGIRILTFVGKPENLTPTTHVGSDDRALARRIARHLFDRLPEGGNVVVLEGNPKSVTTAPRSEGFREAAATRSKIRIAGARAGDYLRDGGRDAMTALLSEVPDIAGILAANDFMALGALDVLHARGLRIPIVGINATPEGVAAIRAGDLLASASFDAMKMGCIAVEAAVRALRGEPVPPEILLPVEIVDRDNAAAWDLPYPERALPVWSETVRG